MEGSGRGLFFIYYFIIIYFLLFCRLKAIILVAHSSWRMLRITFSTTLALRNQLALEETISVRKTIDPVTLSLN